MIDFGLVAVVSTIDYAGSIIIPMLGLRIVIGAQKNVHKKYAQINFQYQSDTKLMVSASLIPRPLPRFQCCILPF